MAKKIKNKYICVMCRQPKCVIGDKKMVIESFLENFTEIRNGLICKECFKKLQKSEEKIRRKESKWQKKFQQ